MRTLRTDLCSRFHDTSTISFFQKTQSSHSVTPTHKPIKHSSSRHGINQPCCLPETRSSRHWSSIRFVVPWPLAPWSLRRGTSWQCQLWRSLRSSWRPFTILTIWTVRVLLMILITRIIHTIITPTHSINKSSILHTTCTWVGSLAANHYAQRSNKTYASKTLNQKCIGTYNGPATRRKWQG